jgi:4-amino-4-deoxy-L-arabinose transferase-like glycosyltransferase
LIDSCGRTFLKLNLILLFAAALWLRVTGLEAIPEVCGDEAWYGVQVGHLLAGQPFATRTYSGNPLNPFFSGLIVPLYLVFGPAGWIIRAPAVLSGVLAVALTYLLGHRILDRPTALIAAVLLAVLPASIVFSRTGFDCSQLPLCGLLSVYFAARGHGPGLILATLAGLVVHPTHVFLLPVPLAVFLVRLFERTAGDPPARRRLLATTGLLAAAAVAAVAAATLGRDFVKGYYVCYYSGSGRWRRFLTGFGRFLLGLNLAPHEDPLKQGWRGPVPEAAARRQDALLWLALGGTLVFGTRRLLRARRWDRLALVLGAALSLAAFHAMAGSRVFAAGTYRYAVVLILPTALAVACLVGAGLAPTIDPGREGGRWFRLALLCTAGWALLLAAKQNWFDPRLRGTGESLWTLGRDRPDSHRRALALIVADRRRRPPDAAPTVIVAQDYWNYRPLQYAALPRRGLDVFCLDAMAVEPDRVRPDLSAALGSGAYAVGFRGGAVERLATADFPPDHLQRWDLPGPGGKGLVVLRLARPATLRAPGVGGGSGRRWGEGESPRRWAVRVSGDERRPLAPGDPRRPGG